MNQPQQQTPPEAWTERTRLLFGDDRVSELAQCHVTDTAFGCSYGAQEGGIVIGVGKQAQVGQNVFDFGFVEKALSTGELVGNARAAQGFFENPRLMVAAV